MSVVSRATGCALLVLVGWAAGCASQETARVQFSYRVEPSRGLPPGLDTVAVLPAKVTEATDPKWSDMSATTLAALISDSKARFGTPVNVTERRDTQAVFDEADLAAAGLSTTPGGTGGQLLGADAYMLSKINVKIDVLTGKQRTLSGVDLSGLFAEGRHGRAGGGSIDVQTEEVENVSRTMTVQTEFKLVDSGNGNVWAHYSPQPYSATDEAKASPFFGSSRTEADLPKVDRIILALVERAAQEFVSTLMPCAIRVETDVESSNNKNCVEGVRQLRAENYEEALSFFQVALSEKPNDHHAAYGAGVACEATGKYDEALRYYKQACALRNNLEYAGARDRVKVYGPRAKPQ